MEQKKNISLVETIVVAIVIICLTLIVIELFTNINNNLAFN